MILLIAKNTVQKGKQQEFTELAKEMIINTRQEPGCVYYDLAANQNDEQVYYFIEKYKDEEAVEYHRGTAYFQTIVPKLGALRVKPSEVSTCTVVE
ncbi:MAG: antibiotic biosynthesis monooxygenase [Anaerotignum sp.]|nr:antibiotic biosynthesis monooxygenase [Anaerotignum sp.]MBQ7084043.1 antibiotic biosynthesis monooxygenase [Anaerotignum sp.]